MVTSSPVSSGSQLMHIFFRMQTLVTQTLLSEESRKGQFIRLRYICSELKDFVDNSKKLISCFVKRGCKPEAVEKCFKKVKSIKRESLFQIKEEKKIDLKTYKNYIYAEKIIEFSVCSIIWNKMP